MKNLTLEPAQTHHATLCATAFVDSDLGRHYEASHDAMTTLFTRGIRKKLVHVALDKGDAFAGFFWFSRGGGFDDFPYLRVLAVNPTMRDNGVGTFLMDSFETMAAEISGNAFLLVSDFNIRAQAFYTRRNWIQCGSIPNLYRAGITEILMRKQLR